MIQGNVNESFRGSSGRIIAPHGHKFNTMKYLYFALFLSIMFASFSFVSKPAQQATLLRSFEEITTPQPVVAPDEDKDSSLVSSKELIRYARTLLGKPYVWGSTNPAKGFDCSGFVNHVATKFGFKVPRSSVQFTDLGEEIEVAQAKAGDLILFTGTNLNDKRVGHMGIITENAAGQLQFIHSSSGKSIGVIESPLEGYYSKRFVKVIRLFEVS